MGVEIVKTVDLLVVSINISHVQKILWKIITYEF